MRLEAQTPAASAVSLTVRSGGSQVTTVASGAVVALSASVTSGGSAVSNGQVAFCDANATDCIGLHRLATVQLNAAGAAVYQFRPGAGNRRFNAIFTGTNAVASSTSSQSSLTVTAAPVSVLSTTTTLSESGGWGNYSLSATVTEVGGTTAPSGTISFVDKSAGGQVLGSADLGAGQLGTTWVYSTSGSQVGTGMIVTGDFNEDGIVDVEVNASNGTATILLGNGDGTFRKAAVSPTTCSGPASTLVGDFNQDGHLDLAVQCGGNEAILLGNGDGTFTETAGFFSVNSLTPTVAGDFNGDGKLDLAFVVTNSPHLEIYLGNGDGTFNAGTQIAVNRDPFSLLATDVNGDGKTDLVVGDDLNATVLLGKGDGTFTALTPMSLPGLAGSIVASDFNGDGKVDLAVGTFNNVEGRTVPITVFLGNGDGTFSVVTASSQVPAADVMAVEDFNGDGIPDLVTPNFIAGGISVLFGRDDGTFTPSPVAPAASAMYASSLAVADFNGDGVPDLAGLAADNSLAIDVTEPTTTAATIPVAVSPGDPGAHLVQAQFPGNTLYQPSASASDRLWGQPPATATTLAVSAGGTVVTSVPAGTIVTLTTTVTAGGSPVSSGQVNFCDAAAPSCTDIHLLASVQVTAAGTATTRFVPGSGSHQYKAVFVESATGTTSSSSNAALTVQPATIPQAAATTTLAQSGSTGNYTLTATVFGIGRTDAMSGSVAFEDTSAANTVLQTAPLGAGTAGIGWVQSFTASYGSTGTLHFAGADFNGDGHLDVSVANENGKSLAIYLGNGTFTTAPGLTLPNYTNGVIAADFNGDGIPDLAVSSAGSGFPITGYLTIFLGKGDGTFTAVSASPAVGAEAVVFCAADIDGDGKLDLIVDEDAGTRILFGNGDGTFSEGPNGLPTTYAVADLNGDGIADLVTGSGQQQAAIYLGNGDGTFRTGMSLLFPSVFDGSVSVGDFNSDGIPDLALTASSYSPVAIWLGKGDGTFTQAGNPGSVSINEPISTVLGDFNADGKTDILVSNGNSYGTSSNPDLTLLLGNGDGTFSVGAVDTQFASLRQIMAGDFDGNGTSDVILDTSNMTAVLTKPTQTATATVTGIALTGPGTHPVDAVYSGDANYLTSTSSTTPLYSQATAPVFSLTSATYTTEQTLSITDATPGAAIYYTLYGPAASVGPVLYTGPVALSYGGTYSVQAYATATGYQQSPTSTATYQLNLPALPALVFTPPGGVYSTAQSVTISDSVPGAVIHYSVNGQVPGVNSPVYSAPIQVSASEQVAAMALAPGYTGISYVGVRYVIMAPVAITWPTPAAVSYGTALSSTQLNATAAIPGTFTYSPAAGTVLGAGMQTLSVTFTPTNTQIYPVTTASVTLRVTPVTPTVTWSPPAAIPYGTSLGSAQLNATASVPGMFAYSPAAGSVLATGSQTLSATFTPTDTTDYSTATASVALTVVNPVPIINSLSPTHTSAGGQAFSLTLTGAGFMPASVVYWNGAALSTQYVNGTQLVAAVPASDFSVTGTASVTVQTPAPGGGSSGVLLFEVDSASSLGASPVDFSTVTATVSAGSAATYQVTLPSSAISATVTCLNLPTGASCAYANGVLTILTSSSTPQGTYVITAVFTETLASAAAGLFLPLLLLWRRRGENNWRRLGAMFLILGMLTLTVGGLALTGCAGGGGSSGSGSPATHQATASSAITLIVH